MYALTDAIIPTRTKPKKKRHKPYTGTDAAKAPTVHHYVAEPKSPVREWWDGHKRAIKLTIYIGGGTLLVLWLLIEFFRMVF